MAGVSAVSSPPPKTARSASTNRSATELIGTGADGLIGRPLSRIAPELAELVDGDMREAIVQVIRSGDTRTLAVRIARTDAGPILTFDDITQQLLDQRRAAWSDVARRIALRSRTRSPRSSSPPSGSSAATAARSTPRTRPRAADRHDRSPGRRPRRIRRVSAPSRACPSRVPRRVAGRHRPTSIVPARGRASVDPLHARSQPAAPALVCDRRQLGQAFTNIVKNAVEAIESKAMRAAA